MAHAFSDLCEALVRAEQALSALEQEIERDTAFEVHVLGLGFQVTYAREKFSGLNSMRSTPLDSEEGVRKQQGKR